MPPSPFPKAPEPPVNIALSLVFLKICQTLKAQKYTKATIEFSGGGDEGSIDNIIFRPAKKRSSNALDDLKEKLKKFTYDLVESQGHDFINNDGGAGNLIIDLTQNTWTLNYTSFEYDYGPANERDDPETKEIPHAPVVFGAREEDFRSFFLSANKTNRVKIISLFPTLLPKLKQLAAASPSSGPSEAAMPRLSPPQSKTKKR